MPPSSEDRKARSQLAVPWPRRLDSFTALPYFDHRKRFWIVAGPIPGAVLVLLVAKGNQVLPSHVADLFAGLVLPLIHDPKPVAGSIVTQEKCRMLARVIVRIFAIDECGNGCAGHDIRFVHHAGALLPLPVGRQAGVEADERDTVGVTYFGGADEFCGIGVDEGHLRILPVKSWGDYLGVGDGGIALAQKFD